MYSLRDKYAISGIGWTEYSKKSGRTVRSLASEACLKAIDDAGLNVTDIDGFVSFNFNDSVPRDLGRHRNRRAGGALCQRLSQRRQCGQHDRADRGRGDRGGPGGDRAVLSRDEWTLGLSAWRRTRPVGLRHHTVHRAVRLDHLSAGDGHVVPPPHDRIRHDVRATRRDRCDLPFERGRQPARHAARPDHAWTTI